MTNPSITPPGPEAAAPATDTDERVRIQGPLRRLLIWLMPTNFSIFILWGAIPGILLARQVIGFFPTDENAQVGNLAIVTTVGAIAAMAAQPIAGAISDRTRTRFGRRAPWMVAGALIGGLSLIGMSLANTVATLVIAWSCVQIAYNFVQGPLSAILPDRVPEQVRGTFSAVLGAATMLGAIGGQVVGASLANNIGAAYAGLAGFTLVMVTLFVVFNPDRSSAGDARVPFELKDFLRTFWVSPVKHSDFFWAFLGRLLLYTGYFSVLGYQLFLLRYYVGIEDLDAATAFVPVLGLLQLVGLLPATLIAGPLSDRIGKRRIFVFISSAIVGLGLIVPWVMPTATGMMIMAVVCGIGFGAFGSVDQALMTQVLPSAESFAKDLGVVNIAATLPQTLAPAIGGAIVLAFGYAGLFPVGIALSIAGAFAVYMIKSVP